MANEGRKGKRRVLAQEARKYAAAATTAAVALVRVPGDRPTGPGRARGGWPPRPGGAAAAAKKKAN